MHVPGALVETLVALASQVDPNAGTMKAQQGAVQRMTEPTYYDVAFPIIAFLLVIVLPVVTAAWVIYKTVTEKTAEPDEK